MRPAALDVTMEKYEVALALQLLEMTPVKMFFQPNRKSVAIGALVLAAVLAIVARQAFRTAPESPPAAAEIVKIQPAAENPPTGMVRAGTIAAAQLLPVYSGFAGKISEVYVQEGQFIKAGQPLFKLEAAFAPVEAAPEPSIVPTKDYSHYQKLFEQGIISRRELDNITARQHAAPRKTNPGAVAAPPAPAITAAPIDGTVTGLTADPGIEVQADQKLLSLGSGQTLEAVVPLEQSDLYRVQLGAPATVEASGQMISGEVSSIFPEVKENSIVAFLAHVSLAHPPAGLLQAGMAVTVRIDTGP